ncbi:MAG: plastocyanin/azurin family copper-binding protein, partial [Blastocatellia bacterium]|nr:plastocyanin/azurin family copper-binding protein [Blastocatellia bacterium]
MRKFLTITLMSVVSLALAMTISSARTENGKAASERAAPAKVTVKIVGFEFQPKTLTVKAGTTVEWINEGTRHSVDADDGSFKSEILKQGDKFEHT